MRIAEHVIFCPPTLGEGRPILVTYYHYSLFHSVSLLLKPLRGKRIHHISGSASFYRAPRTHTPPTEPPNTKRDRSTSGVTLVHHQLVSRKPMVSIRPPWIFTGDVKSTPIHWMRLPVARATPRRPRWSAWNLSTPQPNPNSVGLRQVGGSVADLRWARARRLGLFGWTRGATLNQGTAGVSPLPKAVPVTLPLATQPRCPPKGSFVFCGVASSVDTPRRNLWPRVTIAHYHCCRCLLRGTGRC